jgi:hypothetical protein
VTTLEVKAVMRAGSDRLASAVPRYLGRKKRLQSVAVKPPFLRSQLTEAQLASKILDNGIQGELHRVRERERESIRPSFKCRL